MARDDPIEFEGYIVRFTDKAVLVEYEIGNWTEEIWLPLSQTTLLGDEGEDEMADIVIPEWLAKEKGIL